MTRRAGHSTGYNDLLLFTVKPSPVPWDSIVLLNPLNLSLWNGMDRPTQSHIPYQYSIGMEWDIPGCPTLSYTKAICPNVPHLLSRPRPVQPLPMSYPRMSPTSLFHPVSLG